METAKFLTIFDWDSVVAIWGFYLASIKNLVKGGDFSIIHWRVFFNESRSRFNLEQPFFAKCRTILAVNFQGFHTTIKAAKFKDHFTIWPSRLWISLI